MFFSKPFKKKKRDLQKKPPSPPSQNTRVSLGFDPQKFSPRFLQLRLINLAVGRILKNPIQTSTHPGTPKEPQPFI